jgi:two-component system sensor histidine kinase MprB
VTTWLRRRSFQRRLTALVATAVGVAVALVAVAAYITVSRQLTSEVDQRLVSYHTQIERSLTQYNQFANGDAGPPGAMLRAAQQNGNIVEFAPIDGRPVSLPALEGGAPSTVFPPTRSERAISGADPSAYQLDTVSYGGVEYRVLAMPASLDNTAASFLIATPLTATLHTLARLRLLLYFLLLAGIAVAIGLGLLISRVTIRPVKRLTAAAEHVAATQELNATIDDDGTDELGRLAHAFNAMLGALGASRQQQAQLVSDAGHELRTPLTSLRTNVELMMRAKQLPEADQQELYEDISGQIEELTTLIGDLVELARQEEQQPEPVEVRLDSIVERAAQRAERRAPSLSFDMDLTAGSVRAQPPMLERAVLNVLDNAAKWSPPGGTVEVRLTRGASWVLEVRDHGPGIAAEDMDKVFDRFYRAPGARSMPGSGLGLAIVRQVVKSHGGNVSLTAAPGGGTLVHLELPVVVEEEPDLPDMPPRPALPPPVGPPPAPPPPGDRSTPAGGDGTPASAAAADEWSAIGSFRR